MLRLFCFLQEISNLLRLHKFPHHRNIPSLSPLHQYHGFLAAEAGAGPCTLGHMVEGLVDAVGVVVGGGDEEVVADGAFREGEGADGFALGGGEGGAAVGELLKVLRRWFAGTVVVEHDALAAGEVVVELFVEHVLHRLGRTAADALNEQAVVRIEKDQVAVGQRLQGILVPLGAPGHRHLIAVIHGARRIQQRRLLQRLNGAFGRGGNRAQGLSQRGVARVVALGNAMLAVLVLFFSLRRRRGLVPVDAQAKAFRLQGLQ